MRPSAILVRQVSKPLAVKAGARTTLLTITGVPNRVKMQVREGECSALVNASITQAEEIVRILQEEIEIAKHQNRIVNLDR